MKRVAIVTLMLLAFAPSIAGAGDDRPATTLVEVVRRLLARDPRDRYSSAAAVIRELSAVMGTPLPAETADTRESFLQAAPLIGRDEERQQQLLGHGLLLRHSTSLVGAGHQ